MERDELIEKMLTAYWGEDMDATMHKTRQRMSAALDVVLGEVLGEPSKDEYQTIHQAFWFGAPVLATMGGQ